MFSPVLLVVCGLTLILGDSEPQREVLLFNKADKDNDGQLTRAELDNVYFQFDINHDNSISKTEFDTDWVTTYSLGNHNEAAVLFTRADVNDDGIINKQDLPGIFSFFDKNADGHVSIDEFLTQWGELKLQAVGTIIIDVDNATDTTTTSTTHT